MKALRGNRILLFLLLAFVSAFILIVFPRETWAQTQSRSYTIRFYSENGKKEYKNLRKKVCKNQKVKMPSVSSKNAYAVGWHTKKNSSRIYKVGAAVKVSGNQNYYLKVKKASKNCVNLRYSDGKLYKTLSNQNGTAKFPAVCLDLKKGDNCLGWSRKKGKTSDPDYLAGDKIPAESGDYYMVTFPESQDQRPGTVLTAASYDQVFFIGDSRTWYCREAFSGRIPDNVKFIAKRGAGLSWYKNTGYKLLCQAIQNLPGDPEVAVIFNLGVNDLDNIDSYVSYMKKTAGTLKEKGCDLFYMSVNPVNSAVIGAHSGRVRSECKIASFNNRIYNSLCSGKKADYVYINTCSYLQKKGWISMYRPEYGYYDGLHYSDATSLRIYNYCISYLNQYY